MKRAAIVIFFFCILSGIAISIYLKNRSEDIVFCVNEQKIYSCPIPSNAAAIRLSETQYRVRIPETASRALCEATRACNFKAGDTQQIFFGGRQIASVRRGTGGVEITQLVAQYFPPAYVSVFFESAESADAAIKKFQWQVIADFSSSDESSSPFNEIIGSIFATVKANEFIAQERISSILEEPGKGFYITSGADKISLPEEVVRSILSPIIYPFADHEGKIQIPRTGTWFEL